MKQREMHPTYEQLALIYDAVADPILLLTPEPSAVLGDDGERTWQLRIACVNTAFERALQVQAQDVVGRLFHEAFPGGDKREGYQRVMAAVRSGKPDRYHIPMDHGGMKRALDVTITPILSVDGVCTHVVASAHDVTEETRIREAYRNQFEHAPEAIVVIDSTRGCIVEANTSALRLFNMTRTELIGTFMRDVSPRLQPGGGRSRDMCHPWVDRARAGETPSFEWTFRTKDRRLVPCEMRLAGLPDQGDLLRGTIIDISERKRNEELKRISMALLEENRLIQSANRMKSELVANLSHELRTPLNAILGFTTLLHDGRVGPVSDEQRACLADVVASGQHLLELINGMLDLAKIESGRMEIRAEPVALGALLHAAIDVVRGLAYRKRIVLEVEVDPTLGTVIVDPSRLKQVLFNYLSNALKFTPEGGRVRLRANEQGEHYCVAVEDNGVGIREEDHAKLFVAFSQIDSGLTKGFEGTGLGLALTKRIVQAMGGGVGFESAVGAGSTFFAILPKAGPDHPLAIE